MHEVTFLLLKKKKSLMSSKNQTLKKKTILDEKLIEGFKSLNYTIRNFLIILDLYIRCRLNVD